MGNSGWFWPILIIGGLLVGGYFLLRSIGGALVDPKIQGLIHKITDPRMIKLEQDLQAGRITEAQAQAKVRAMGFDSSANMGYYY